MLLRSSIMLPSAFLLIFLMFYLFNFFVIDSMFRKNYCTFCNAIHFHCSWSLNLDHTDTIIAMVNKSDIVILLATFLAELILVQYHTKFNSSQYLGTVQ